MTRQVATGRVPHTIHGAGVDAVLAPPGAGPSLRPGWDAVLATWRTEGVWAEQSADRMEQIGSRFVARLEAVGRTGWGQVGPSDCQGFVLAVSRSGHPPSVATQHLRRSTVRALFRTLRSTGQVVGDPTIDLVLPPRGARVYRPLTDDEVLLCRTSSRLGASGSRLLHRAVAWALGEATGATSEIGAVRIVDVDNRTRPRWVTFSDSGHHAARRGELSQWGSRILSRRLEQLRAAGADEHAVLAYSGTGPAGQYLAQASVCTQLTRVLAAAGLQDDPGVRARSLRGWAGERLHRGGMPLEQVAVRLGCRSLDRTAVEIGLSWAQPHSP